MARSTFGGGASDWVFSVTPGQLVRVASATLTFWDASAGGTQHTDLLVGSTAVTQITVGESGQVPEFQGPDGVYAMWADTGTGAPRVQVAAGGDIAVRAETAAAAAQAAQAAAEAVGDTNDTIMAGVVNDEASATYAAIVAGFARGQVVTHPRWGADPTGASDSGPAIQAALDFLVPTADGQVQTLYIPDGHYISNQPLTNPHAVNLVGAGRLGTIIGLGPLFPSGGSLFSFTYSDGTSLPSLETHTPGLTMRGFTLDGALRSIPATALTLRRFNRLQLDIGVNAFDGSALRVTHSLGESRIAGLRTWLCGNATSPVVDVDQANDGSAEGSNLNHWHGVELMYSLGDQVRFRSEAGVSTRYQTFTQCTFHGVEEWLDDYYDDLGQPITLDYEGDASCRIVVDNARGIKFDNCRIRRNGRGQPNLLLTNRTAGGSTVNSAAVVESALTFRGGAYSSRALGTVDATANTLTLAGVATNRHHLQTGSRVRFTGSALPPPLAAATDYYAVRVDATTFKVATSRANALAGTAVDLTGTGTGTVTQYDTAVTADATANTLTAVDHRLTTGARFRVEGASVPSGLASGADYFVVRVDKDTLQLATTRADAEAGNVSDLTSVGSEVRITPQDFLGDIESGTLQFDLDTIDGPAPTRGYFRVESGGDLITGVGNSWAAGASAPVAEYATGGAHNWDVPGTLLLGRNNEGVYVTRTDGTAVLAMRMAATNTVQCGALTGTDDVGLVGAGLATITAGVAERFRAGATGVAFNGVTAQVARRTVNAAATDTATTQALVNQLRSLLVDLGLAQ